MMVGIGQVLAELRPDFPDISPSKIRFLEAEGLISPQRAESGYRRFAARDIERLRFILTAQRDEYLPLRVIKERLAAIDSAALGYRGAVGPPTAMTMTRSELIEAAGADEELLAELEDFGLVRRARQYGTEALTVARSAVALGEYGIAPRHLRAVKAAAEREISLVEQVVAPLARQRAGREPALRTGRAVAELIAALHATLVEEGLNDAGLACAPPVPGTYPVTGRDAHRQRREAPGLRSASGR
ncbi:MAG TPA: MerR family transcriptional regulator [Trebonia sp.]|jgi:DNA-binding transcriptional MerR regulator|nr:MerR family transcriptional regulator [Trebonia sp.]